LSRTRSRARSVDGLQPVQLPDAAPGRVLELFCEHWVKICEAAAALERLTAAPAAMAVEVAAIRRLEVEADQIARRIFTAANRTFLAPIDREDILALAHVLDDVIDLIEDTAKVIERYAVTEFADDMRAMVGAVQRAVAVIRDALPLLDRPSRNAATLLALCEQIAQIEGDVDDMFDAGLTRLHDALRADMVKLPAYLERKEIYEHLEAVVDTCDDVANAVESITAKHV
jgi:predicted phosphate transport protein (TIGR00153 family)